MPEYKAKSAIIVAPNIKGFKYLLNEIPELRMAVTSELLAILDVNQITDKKTKTIMNFNTSI